MDIGPSEAETFWTAFLRKLARRGLRGVKLVISDAHEGIKAAVAKVLHACWQRCRVHFMRNALAHAGKSGRRVVSAFIATAFAQDDAEAAKAQWRRVADQLRPKLPPASAAVCRKYPRSFVVLAISRSPGGAMKVNGENKKPGPLRRSGIS
jgi:transposase-like protein